MATLNRTSHDGRRTSILSLQSIDFFTAQLAHAHALTLVASRSFGGEYRKDERPEDGDVLTVLQHAGKLLHECISHVDDVPTPGSPWWLDLRAATSLVDVFDRLTRADSMEITFSDGVTCEYLSCIAQAIERARAGLASVTATSGRAVHGERQEVEARHV